MRSTIRRRTVVISIAVIAVLVGTALGTAQTSLADTAQVQITQQCTGGAYGSCQYAFAQGQITVPAGSTITWVNSTDTIHTATSDSSGFDTGVISAGGHASVTLNAPGTFTYHCDIHPYMHGSIVVTGAAPTQTAVSVPPTSTAIPPTPAGTAVQPTTTPTAQPTATTAATATVTTPTLTLRATLSPKRVHPTGKLRLSVSTLPGSALDVTVSRPGVPTVHRHATAGRKGSYRSTISIPRGARHGTVTVRVTAKRNGQTARATARAAIR